ncbi:hypothetical protein [Nocardia sp. NPDC004722]
MGADLISLAVAGVGVVGTFGAAVAAQGAALKGKRLDAEIHRAQQAEQRDEAAQQREREQKQSVYSEFNSAARNYRMQLHHCVMELEVGGAVGLERLEAERTHYRTMYAQAQMIVPDRLLAVASEVDLCLGNTYRAVHDMVEHPDVTTLRAVHEWLDGSASEAVWLLRQMLREDLGASEPIADLDARIAAMSSARAELFDTGSGRLRCHLKGDAGVQ